MERHGLKNRAPPFASIDGKVRIFNRGHATCLLFLVIIFFSRYEFLEGKEV